MNIPYLNIKATLKTVLLSSIFLAFSFHSYGQNIPSTRLTDWTQSGLMDSSTVDFKTYQVEDYGLVGDGATANDEQLKQLLSTDLSSGALLIFPEGNFLFNQGISLPSNTLIKGQGAGFTTLTLDLEQATDGIMIQGSSTSSETTSIIKPIEKGATSIQVNDPSNYKVGDWIKILLDDSDLITSDWAKNSVGQIAQISTINNQEIILHTSTRMDYDMSRNPYIQKIEPKYNIGIECLKIERKDNTAPTQSSNISFHHAVNCWVSGVESENCTFSHVQASSSSNISISKSYFHHAFEYGSGGRAYGVMLQQTSGECLVENNIFEHLRHSMIVQSGANGNVFAYNYSFDPYWTSIPNNSTGDMVLHGNYPYANLFEHNICQNIVVDNSHGPNGPNNLIFRNKAEGYGIFFSADNSPNQLIIGNQISNSSFPFSLINYTIQGDGHYIYGNNNKGTIHPKNTEFIAEPSFCYTTQPEWLSDEQWAIFGSDLQKSNSSIPSKQRNDKDEIFLDICGVAKTTRIETSIYPNTLLSTYPNPFSTHFILNTKSKTTSVVIRNINGQIVYSNNNVTTKQSIHTSEWSKGIYIITASCDFQIHNLKLIKN